MIKLETPNLTLIGSTQIGPPPPRPLGRHGHSLWDAVMAEYRIEDIGGRELLAQAASALDRAELLAEAIARDGATFFLKGVPKSHPAIKDELQNRAFVVKTLERLGISVEAVKAVGRPGIPTGWRGPNVD
jgi:hypothetical protein